MSWRLTTLAKLSVDVSDVFSHELSRKVEVEVEVEVFSHELSRKGLQ